MFSLRSFTWNATSASRRTPSSANVELDALGRQQRAVLLVSDASGSVRIRTKSSTAERVELHADREAALQLGDQVGRLGQVERAGGDEQHVIGAAPCRTSCLTVQPSTSGSRSRCTPSRETSAPCVSPRARDLVDLVDEHDAVLLGVAQRLQLHSSSLIELRRFLFRRAACSASLDRAACGGACGACPRFWNMPCSCCVISSMPAAP